MATGFPTRIFSLNRAYYHLEALTDSQRCASYIRHHSGAARGYRAALLIEAHKRLIQQPHEAAANRLRHLEAHKRKMADARSPRQKRGRDARRDDSPPRRRPPPKKQDRVDRKTVSYTHLTLPTKA